jgi:peptide-methionine (S)-S-oxide reductase
MSEMAVLGGGCFWCLEAVYDDLEGVESVESGYMGGVVPEPSYELVCSGRTGHAEVVRVTFDPARIKFREILEVFFTVHDPTTLNRQGHDAGTQYRSVVFYHSDEQRLVAGETIREWNAQQVWPDPIVTEVVPAAEFWEAEAYHQEYFARNPYQPYCLGVVAPKVRKFREKFAGRRATPDGVRRASS